MEKNFVGGFKDYLMMKTLGTMKEGKDGLMQRVGEGNAGARARGGGEGEGGSELEKLEGERDELGVWGELRKKDARLREEGEEG